MAGRFWTILLKIVRLRFGLVSSKFATLDSFRDQILSQKDRSKAFSSFWEKELTVSFGPDFFILKFDYLTEARPIL